jgi:hypothetical protein
LAALYSITSSAAGTSSQAMADRKPLSDNEADDRLKAAIAALGEPRAQSERLEPRVGQKRQQARAKALQQGRAP